MDGTAPRALKPSGAARTCGDPRFRVEKRQKEFIQTNDGQVHEFFGGTRRARSFRHIDFSTVH